MPSRKIYMNPAPSQAEQDTSNSIHQIVLRLRDNLPEWGWQITENIAEADLVALHAGQSYSGKFDCDIAHCHGVMPTFDQPQTKWWFGANANVIETLRHARAITVPSTWVADIIRRELNREPLIVNWAIEHSQWNEPIKHESNPYWIKSHYRRTRGGYTLWNKTRADSTCDPTPIEYLASKITDAEFMTTFSNEKLPNLQVTGRQTFEKMKDMVRYAALYLATTKETFGIGTLEAMACGIPVLGYNWGGTADIVEHGVTGYLVEPGDLDGLVTGWRWCMRHRDTLGQNARKAALDKHYSWERVAAQFAALYDETWEAKEAEKWQQIKVSVVIPCFNYANWLPDAVRTVAMQKADFKFEICIVDDGSTDDSFKVALALKEQYKDFCNIIVCHKANEGVAIARDYGIQTTIGKYIVCLDADDQLGTPEFLQTLYDALEAEPLLGLAYCSLAMFKGNAEDGCSVSAWPGQYNAAQMFDGHNQVPTCNMFRRRAYEQTGGYRKHLTPAEDAGLWFSMALLGWNIRKVTEKPMFLYRLHDNSLSSSVRKGERGEPKWTHLSDAATARRYPMAAQIPPVDKNLPSHPVRNYDRPLVSVIIPVGAKHAKDVSRALDSVASQTEWRWEAIIINDTGDKLELQQRWAKVINAYGSTPKGAAHARNLGIKAAVGRFLVFLDADDAIEPSFIEKCYQMFRAKGYYVYTDWFEERSGKRKEHKTEEYSQEAILKRMSIHPVTVFVPKEWVIRAGCFDESFPLWEDSELFIKLAILGYCGQHLAEPLFVYNIDSGTRREDAVKQSESLKTLFRSKFGDYFEGKKTVMGCCGQKPKKVTNPADYGDAVKVMLQNGKAGGETIRGAVSRKSYGVKRHGDIFVMLSKDAAVDPDIFVVITEDISTVSPTPEPAAPMAL